jgi:hypothetical protein
VSRARAAGAVLLAVVVLLLGLAGTAAPAAAVPPSAAVMLPDLGCPPGVPESKEAPAPQLPGRGLTGSLLPAPEQPTTQDPFAEESDTSIYEAYGLAGLRWNTYDLGCGAAAANPAAAADTSVANLLLTTVPVAVTAVTGALAGTVYEPTWLAVFDEPLREISLGLRDVVYTPLAPLALLLTGIALMWSARRARFSAAATTVALVLAALAVVSVATAVPTRLGSAADTAMTSGTGYVNATLSGREDAAADPGAEAVAPFVDNVLYPRWLAGTLGDSTGETARTYGPDLFRASALTWAEAAEVQGDPERARELVEEKQQLWTRTAEAVEEADPDAYEYLTGARQNRFGEAFAASLAVGVLLFPIMAFLLMMAGYVLIRLTVMTAPLWATFALLPGMGGILPGAGKLLLAAVVNPFVAAVGATLTINVTSLLIAPDAPVPLWLGLILSLIVCVLAWVALRPFHRIWALVTGNPLARAGDSLRADAGRARRAVAGGLGWMGRTKVASMVVSDDVADELAEREETAAARVPAGERFVRTAPQRNLDSVAEPTYALPAAAAAVGQLGPSAGRYRNGAGAPTGGPGPEAASSDGWAVPSAAPGAGAPGGAQSRALTAPPRVHGGDDAGPAAVPAGARIASGGPSRPGDGASDDAAEGADAGPSRGTRRVEPTVALDGQEVYVLLDYAAGGLRVDEPVAPGSRA